jgi:thiol-disulfide isomerase/thioredoxin
MSNAPIKALGVVAVLAMLLLGLAAQAADLPPLTHNLTPVEDAPPAPPLRLMDLDDEEIDLEVLRGKVVVVNFWATWCPPCRREMPSLERLKLATAEHGVEVLAVNIGEDVDTVFAFTGTLDPQPTFPLLLDLDSGSLAAWKVKGLPTTYVVAPDGHIAYRAVGGREFDHPEIIEQLVALSRGDPE